MLKTGNLSLFAALFVLLPHFWASACVTEAEVHEEGSDIASNIVFHRADENYAIQQHLVYHKGRPYFNYSKCWKEHGSGFNVKDAYEFDLKKDCFYLGQWIPVYDPFENDVFTGLFLKKFKSHMDENMDNLGWRSYLAPTIEGIKQTLNEYNHVMLSFAGITLLHQGYVVAAAAQRWSKFTSQKSAQRLKTGGGLLAVIGILGLFAEPVVYERRYDIHQQKIQELIYALTALEKDMKLLRLYHEGEQALRQENAPDDDESAPIHFRVVSMIEDSIGLALAELELKHPGICKPMRPRPLIQIYGPETDA
ncbi:MAG: hypothetical protein AAF203_08065 [Pseudomonadota bacterium]